MKLQFLFLLLLFFLSGCDLKSHSSCSVSTEITFLNKSNMYAHLTISTGKGGDSIVLNTQKNSSMTEELCFNTTLKSDGNYFIRFSSPIKDTSFFWGYFSNGAPSEEGIEIVWESDSLKLKSVF